MPIFDRLRQLCCHHEDVLRLSDTAMWLECMGCGRTTHGFQGLGRAMQRTATEEPRRVEGWRIRILDRAA
jgi:hypothetical protein